MPRKYREYSDQDIANAVRTSESLAQVLRKLGLRVAGGNYANIRANIQRLGLPTEHFTGKLWSKGKRLQDWTSYTDASRLKKHLLVERGHACEMCERSIWIQEPIALELHHLDGDRTHNAKSNLQLLCPNCHATTANWRNRKRTKPNQTHSDFPNAEHQLA